MAKEGTINRTLSKDESKSGNSSGRILEKGTKVYEFNGATYGAISRKGIAVSDKPDQPPFYEVPKNSVDWK